MHEVEIMRGFWLGQTPVTQRQYAAFDDEHKNDFPGNPEHPAESIDWNRAVAFCEWLTERLDANEWHGGSAGLPSEAQWEYACRAGTQTDYHTGDGAAALHLAGWFNDNAKGATQPVGQREANGFGLYDMCGNVVEWCRDAWDEHAYRRRAERAAEAGGTEGEDSDPARVVRGGAWADTAGVCRAAYRNRGLPGYGIHFQGFRVAVFPGPSCPDKTSASEGSERAAGRRAGSARARGEAGTAMDHDNGDTMNEIALSSLDGQQWHDAEDKPGAQDIVTRVVIGKLDAEEPITITDALWQQVLAHWSSITHLHLWSIEGLNALPELPAKLECLDLRHCKQLESLPALPDTLVTLDLADCTALKQLPAGNTPALRFLHLDDCTKLDASAINAKIGACPKLEELTLAGCLQLEMLDGLGNREADGNFPLRKLVLRGCARLARLPHLRGLGKLQHLNLSDCKVLLALPSIPDSLQYLNLSGCDRLVEFDGQGIDIRDRGASDTDNMAPWFQVRRRYGEAPAFSARAKLLLLGDGRAGKTTLAKRLVWNSLAPAEQGKPDGQAMRPTAGEPFTHQIRFFQWRCPVDVPEQVASRAERLISDKGRLHGADECHGGQATARVGIWDFGGQEIYHRTHRLFTSAGNVFLIVWRAALDEVEIRASCPGDMPQDEWLELNRQRPLDYWLQYVHEVNPQARLALVCTHRAGGDSMPDWSNRLVDRSLRALDVRKFFVDSLEDDADKAGELSDLHDWLRDKLAKQVEENGLIVPLFFAQVGERIEAMLAENDAARRELRLAQHLLLEWPRWCDEVRRVHSGLALSVALQEEDIRELTMHLHRTGALFLLDPSAGERIEHAQVVIDQSWTCGIMYEVLRPGGALRARIKRNGGWFERGDLDLSPVWKALDPGRRQSMIEVMQQCALVVEIAHWAQGPEMPRTVYLANEKWLLPAFSDVQNRLDAAKAAIRGDVKSQRLVLKQPSIDEFRAHRLMAELCRKFGRSSIWFRTGLQSIEDRSVPTWCLRVRWSASDERVGYLGTVDAQVFACAEVLAAVLTEFHKLFADIGFPIDAPTLDRAEVPSRLHEAGNYFRLSLRSVADVGISARGANAEPVGRFVGVLREAGVEDVKWYREDEHQAQIRASGVSHYMEQVLGKSLVQVLFFSDQYLEDGDDNLHCPWELANVIKEWKANRLARDRVVVVWLPRAECGLDEVATRIKLVFKSLSRRFLDRYRASDSENDLDDHRHFKDALAHVDEFLGARGSWRGHFYTLDDPGSATTGSAVIKQVLALLQQ